MSKLNNLLASGSLFFLSSSVFAADGAKTFNLDSLVADASGISGVVVAGIITVGAALVAPRLALKAVQLIRGAISSS